MRANRTGWPVVAIGAVLAIGPAAWAAGKSSISIKVPASVKAGALSEYSVSGRSATKGKLGVFFAHKACASSYAAERPIAVGKPEVLEVSAGTVAVARPFQTNSGESAAWHICAYLFSKPSKTLAKAAATFTATG